MWRMGSQQGRGKGRGKRRGVGKSRRVGMGGQASGSEDRLYEERTWGM